jgi:hypothetical protein
MCVVKNHDLPEANTVRCMQRQGLEVTLQAPFGPLRLVNTHLEYYSVPQREAQLLRLMDLQEEASTSPKLGQTIMTIPILACRFLDQASTLWRFQFRRVQRAIRAYRRVVSSGAELSGRLEHC